MNSTALHPDVVKWVIIPLLIYIARIVDVTFGTLRIIFVAKGQRLAAPLLGFVETLVYLVAISQALQNLDTFLSYFAYAAGFATGNYVGISIENRLAMGVVLVRVITAKDAKPLFQSLALNGYGATWVDGQGASGHVTIIYSVIRRKDLTNVLAIIQSFDPNAFYSVEDARLAAKGIFPPADLSKTKNPFTTLRMRRKEK